MRRIFWTTATLAIAGLAAFLVGWLPLRVEPGTYAVIVTKTGGVDPVVVAPGSFRWSAAAFLPTNLRLVTFAPAMTERRLEAEGELPSAKAYGAFMAGEPDFSYSVSARLVAAPKPEALPELYERWGVRDDEGLASWLASEMDLAAAELRASLGVSRDILAELDESSLALAISAAHPLLDVRGVRLSASRMPDARLYAEARRLYGAYVERFASSLEAALAEASTRAAEDQVRLDVLARYGELLERYPALVDYLAIQAGLAPRPAVGK
jgi:hypothetical protein